MNCKQVLGKTAFLWIAFQSNCLNDRCYSSDHFESAFDEMIEFLKDELKFYSPNLKLNMRNSSEVGNLAKSLKSDFGRGKITNLIESLPTPKSSICATKPTLFPVSRTDLKDYDKLFEKATEKGAIKVVLISSVVYFDIDEIKRFTKIKSKPK